MAIFHKVVMTSPGTVVIWHELCMIGLNPIGLPLPPVFL